MKIIIYSDSMEVVEIIENIKKPIVDKNNVDWEDGSFQGINLPFLLVEDDLTISHTITDEILQADKKNEYTKIDYIDLKTRQDLMEKALDDLILGGML